MGSPMALAGWSGGGRQPAGVACLQEIKSTATSCSPACIVFVATLGYSRRCHVAVFLHERQSAWLQGVEGVFRHFGGVPHEVLVDNAKALVDEHSVRSREVRFNQPPLPAHL